MYVCMHAAPIYVQSISFPCRFYCLGIAPRANLLKKSDWLFYQIRDEAAPAGRVLNRRCYPHTGNGGHMWCSLSLSVGFSIQDEAVDIAGSAPQGTHYHLDASYLLP